MKYLKPLIFTFVLLAGCKEDPDPTDQWVRHPGNPIFRDPISGESYESASDPHVFFDDQGELHMIYSGDVNGKSSIKLAKGESWTDWKRQISLLSKTGPSGLDIFKETAFYRRSSNGKHQIYYIGYPDEDTYQSQIFLAESENLQGPYTQIQDPVIPRGSLAGNQVYAITSPSIVEHEGRLYMTFIGWNDSPANVTEVWIMGAISDDDGYKWADIQVVDARIGMEGQVTKAAEGLFYAVRTGEYNDVEAIFLSRANHPFGPWTEEEAPILVLEGPPYEKDEIIVPQLTIDPVTGKQYLYYTGADYQTGWWVMLATKEP